MNLDDVFNKSGIHDQAPCVYDEFFTKDTPGFSEVIGKDEESGDPIYDGKGCHKLFTTYEEVDAKPFVVGKHEYLPFPLNFKVANPNLHDVLGCACVRNINTRGIRKGRFPPDSPMFSAPISFVFLDAAKDHRLRYGGVLVGQESSTNSGETARVRLLC